jgi:hypothetical protein
MWCQGQTIVVVFVTEWESSNYVRSMGISVVGRQLDLFHLSFVMGGINVS